MINVVGGVLSRRERPATGALPVPRRGLSQLIAGSDTARPSLGCELQASLKDVAAWRRAWCTLKYRDVEGWAEFSIKNHEFDHESVITHMRDEYSTFSWVIERMLTDVGFQTVSADYHAPLHGTYLLRKPKAGEQS